ncbi:hypothetical protein C0R05_32695 [Streptomyces albidoflavus]|nr:hypothetical protein C0R05_32695 [Streptomyces albidoflavus]
MNRCPRCLGPLAAFSGDRGARSRMATDRGIRICGKCGTDEAVRDAAGLAPIPPDEWPVKGLLSFSDLAR